MYVVFSDALLYVVGRYCFIWRSKGLYGMHCRL